MTLRLTTLPNAIVVPSQAVQTGQDGQFVFVVKADSTVEQRTVTAGQRVADDVVIAKGLKLGETVVTEGQLRLEPGTRVTSGSARRPRAAADVDAAGAAREPRVVRAARVAGRDSRRRASVAPGSRQDQESLVNISEIFIRRPIATSLLMAGHRALRRRRVPRAAGQRSAAGRLSRR